MIQPPADPEHSDYDFKTVTFILPARNEERFLRTCLESVAGQAIGNERSITTKIVVVDNGSTDRTPEIARTFGASVLSVAACNPARARNVGAKECNSDLLAFVDADCILPVGWLENGIKYLRSSNTIGYGSVQAIPPPDAPWVERVWVDTIVPKISMDRETVTWLPAFNLLVRREDFERVQGFDEELETCEDSDFSFRISKQGTLLRDHQFPVRHLGESQSLSQFLRREMWRSRGNFKSATKRGTTVNERASLFVPLIYMSGLVALVVALIAAIFERRILYLAVLLLAFVVSMPMAAAYRKCGFRLLPQRSFLLAVYLLARGLGSLYPSRRVGR